MSEHDKHTLKNNIKTKEDLEDESGSGESGQGGKGGQIEFRDFFGMGGSLRDDQLSHEAIKVLLGTHAERNARNVNKQKDRMKEYKDLKDGKIPYHTFAEGLRKKSSYLPNPVLADKAQFSGSVENKVNPSADKFDNDTNEEKKAELTYKHEPKQEYAPRYSATPKPSPLK